MYLRRLEIQGYKSFANRTEFSFNGGITAIVGPNGSGKSNIADAVRWALGEQSYSALRAKRTEDLIFSGSAQRARLGLAEVSLVFDNSTHWLPIDYNEIIVTRRAYRSGENEYYLNGSRVRLRDVAELLTRGGLGRNASIVIGQGQVDAALSLRPEERRSLFEQAAGVRIYLDKRDEALARLEETHRNLERLNDIITEIAPRLETLRRQAERTREHDVIRRDLEAGLLLYYGYQWHQHQDRLAEVEQKIAEQSARVDRQRAQVQRIVAEREDRRARHATLRDDIARRRQARDQLSTRYEELRRQLAVMHERARSHRRQEEQALSDLAAADARCSELRAALDLHTQEMADLQAAIAGQQARAAAAQAQLAQGEATLQAQRDELERARAAAFEVATAQAAARNRLAQLERRRADLEHDLAREQAALAEMATRLERAAGELASAESEREGALLALNRAEEALRAAEDSLAASLSRLDQLRAQRDAAREAYQSLSTQLDVLQRARGQASHLHEGAQAVIRERMPGVLGTISSLLQAPPELEAAIEAGLGGHLEDIVVKTWDDALACIDLLKRRERGRATFLPLDYVRPMAAIAAPKLAGVRGIAARLVSEGPCEKADPVYSGIFELLLGNVVVVDDLPAGRRALAAERRLRRAVTLDGDVVEARGIVRGGSRPRGRGILAQEREWRELPGRVAAARQALERAEAQVRLEDESQSEHRRQARECGQRLQAARTALNEQDQRVSAHRQRHDRLLQESAWHRTLEEQARQSLGGVQVDLAQAQGELAALDRQHQEIAAQVEALRASLEGANLQELRRLAAECETALAVSLRTQEARQQFAASQRQALAQAEAEVQSLKDRLERLRAEASALQRELADSRQALAAVQQEVETAAAPLAAADAELQAVEKQQIALEADEGRARHELQTQQAELSRLGFERERVARDLDEVRRQMESELGPVEVPDVGQPRQLRLELGDGVTPLPEVRQLPEGLARDVRELRARLRRVGPVNPNAPAEYEEVRQRHQFLTEQVQDLSRAADAARQVIAELNRLIRERFTHTFAQVAREFSACFSALFDGGSARLVLTEPDNPTESGIDIIARPPSKRSQSLALLSGGERALTATALLFALLKVNPLPFCVLDEVDAMLDEANVHRFRAFLENLARHTQFIIITHNRATIEAASTVYGISMAQEGISQVLSLRLPDGQPEGKAEAAPVGEP